MTSVDKFGREINSMVDKGTQDKAKGMMANAFDQIKSAARSGMDGAADSAKQVAESAEGTANGVLNAMGQRVEQVANSVHGVADRSGPLRSTVEGVSSSLEDTAEFLKKNGVREIFADTTAAMKEHPFITVMTGIGIGYLIGRSRSSI